jgi:hypothetical protein
MAGDAFVHSLDFRVTADEWRVAVLRAHGRGETLSDYLRHCAGFPPIFDTDRLEPRPMSLLSPRR